MRYLKMLWLLAVAAAALMAFAGTASATITSGGSAYTGEISASSSNFEIDGTVDIKCKNSTIAGTTTAGATSFPLSTLTFTECGADTVSVILKGTISISSSGVKTSAGAEVTVQVHRTVFGFPITTHCIYSTIGGYLLAQLTESTTLIHLGGNNIPKTPTDSACGENAQWTGTYTISKPGPLTID